MVHLGRDHAHRRRLCRDQPQGNPLWHGTGADQPTYFQAVILSIYISCWAIGTSIDTTTQDSVYLVDPQGGHIRTRWFFAVGALAVISVVVLLVRDDERHFALALAVFSAVDVGTWLYLRYLFLPPIIDATAKQYKRAEHGPDYFGLVRLRIIVAQVLGNWKWYRQVFLSAIIVLMLATAFNPPLSDAISEWAERHLPVPRGSIRPLFQDFLLLAFVMISEIWHFALRLKTFLAVRLLTDLETTYSLRPNEAKQRSRRLFLIPLLTSPCVWWDGSKRRWLDLATGNATRGVKGAA